MPKAPKLPKIELRTTLQCSVYELRDEILTVCREGFAPPIEIDESEAAYIAGWLAKTFRKGS